MTVPLQHKVLLRVYLDQKRLKSRPSSDRCGTDRPAAADAAEFRLTLLDALGQLDQRDRAIIVLRYWEDHSIQTVSDLLDLSPGVVKVQSMRALARLRALLGEEEAPPPLPPEPGARDAVPRAARGTVPPLSMAMRLTGNCRPRPQAHSRRPGLSVTGRTRTRGRAGAVR